MLNQSSLLVMPTSTELSRHSITLTLYHRDHSEEISRYRVTKEGNGFSQKEWKSGNTFRISANGTYKVEAQTQAGETLLRTFSIDFLNSQPSFCGGDGSTSSPYLIATATQLNAIRCDLSAHYQLIADIDLADPCWGIGWQPIGALRFWSDEWGGHMVKHQLGFSGTLDGNGHVIKNLTAVYPQIGHLGLFGYLSGTVKNLCLDQVFLMGKIAVGGIAGYFHGNISSCFVSGKISGIRRVGGIVGVIFENVVFDCIPQIAECEFNGVLQARDQRYSDFFGGIAGCCDALEGTISDCIVNADFENCWAVQGICGYTPTEITNCLIRGHIHLSAPAGNSSAEGIGVAHKWFDDGRFGRPVWNVYGCVNALSEVSFTGGTMDSLMSSYQRIANVRDDMIIKGPNYQIKAPAFNIYLGGERITLAGELMEYHQDFPIDAQSTLSKEVLLDLGWDFTSIWEMGEDGWPHLQHLKKAYSHCTDCQSHD